MVSLFGETHVDFVGKRRLFYFVSAGVILAGIVSFIVHGGFRLGIDFAGGRLIEFRLSEPVAVDEVRAAVGAAGLAGAEIQRVRESNQVLIRIPEIVEQKGGEASLSSRIAATLEQGRPGLDVELLREESIGAKVGKEIRGQAFWAVLLASGLILLYIAFRFEFWFGLGAVIALIHDVLVVLTVFSLFNLEITMPVIAGVLTVVGYSVNDTIVVFDRVREQLVRLRRESFPGVLNISINQTLSRTVITAGTTLLTALALFLLGGGVIRDFALAIAVGIVTGTYSSIFVASSLVLELRHARKAPAAA